MRECDKPGTEMATVWRLMVTTSVTVLSFSHVLPMVSSSSTSSLGNLDRCGGRLERALDALQRDSPRRNRLDEEEGGIVYRQKLASAPLDMTVSRIAVKLPQDSRNHGGLWARVEKCAFEPKRNALQTRIMFNDLSVAGIVSLQPRDYRAPIPAETCRMSLRLRRAGIEFYTSPIARGRGQMRIRTESSFLEPRFASIYAYGCRPTRIDKQIKRHDKWPHTNPQYQNQQTPALPTVEEPYEAPEPREIAALTKEEDIAIANESSRVRGVYDSDGNLGVWRKNVWVTKIPRKRERRGSLGENSTETNFSKPVNSSIISPVDFLLALAGRATRELNVTKSAERITDDYETGNYTDSKNSSKRETTLSQLLYSPNVERREREFLENDFQDQALSGDISIRDDEWQSRESISNEMEDVFLRGASQALTRYIERELHPAIKETLMLSMGYTISYG